LAKLPLSRQGLCIWLDPLAKVSYPLNKTQDAVNPPL
jgi:hypothetical protein